MSWYNRAILPVRTVIRDILKNCREETELFPGSFGECISKALDMQIKNSLQIL